MVCLIISKRVIKSHCTTPLKFQCFIHSALFGIVFEYGSLDSENILDPAPALHTSEKTEFETARSSGRSGRLGLKCGQLGFPSCYVNFG